MNLNQFGVDEDMVHKKATERADREVELSYPADQRDSPDAKMLWRRTYDIWFRRMAYP